MSCYYFALSLKILVDVIFEGIKMATITFLTQEECHKEVKGEELLTNPRSRSTSLLFNDGKKP